jgi:hypothetical protein
MLAAQHSDVLGVPDTRRRERGDEVAAAEEGHTRRAPVALQCAALRCMGALSKVTPKDQVLTLFETCWEGPSAAQPDMGR